MELSNRPVEWIAISAVVAGGLWAAFALAPGSGPASSQASRGVFDAHEAGAPGAAPAFVAPVAAQAPAAQGDRLLVVPERQPAAAAPAAAVSAVASASPAEAPRARFSPPRLKATRPIVTPDDRTQSSAFMAAGAGPDDGGAEPSATSVTRSLASRTGELAPAASVRYGVVDRTSLMSRGAGPVYNFKARSSRSRPSGQ